MSKETGGPAFPCDDVYYGLTQRQYAAIKLKVPDSGADWLDEMIKESLRNDFAAKAMQGMLFQQAAFDNPGYAAEWAYEFADAMLKERKK